MKRRDLLRHLHQHGCQFVREGAAHSIWENRVTSRRASIPVIGKSLIIPQDESASSLAFLWYEAHGIGRRDIKMKTYLD